MRKCATCGVPQQRAKFSATQWKKSAKAKCISCVRPSIPSSPLTTLKMFHGTSLANAEQIKEAGFVPSPDGLLGPGVYVAREDKATRFARNREWHGGNIGAVITVVISYRRAKFVSDNDKVWQQEGYDACRTTKTSSSPNMEWCVASARQVKVVGITKIDCDDSEQLYHEVPTSDHSYIEHLAAAALLDHADPTRLSHYEIEASYGSCVLFFASFGLKAINTDHCHEALSISRGLQQHALRTKSTPLATNRAARVKVRVKAVAKAFYSELVARPELRERCQDRTVFKSEYETWQAETWQTTHDQHGSFSQAFYQLQRQGAIVKKDASDDASVVVFKIDKEKGISVTALRSSISKRVKANRAKIEADKCGITVALLQLDACYRPGTKVSSSMVVSNKSGNPVELTAVSWLNKSTTLECSCMDALPLTLYSGCTTQVTITCTPSFGVCRGLLELQFEQGGFCIGRYVEVEAGDCDLHEVLKPSAPYKKRRPQKKQPEVNEATHGEPPAGSGARWVKDVDQYVIPVGFRAGVIDGTIEDQLECGLTFDGYQTFFDALLWAEEGQQYIDIREFDIEGTILTAVSSKLLALQVPGLSESRPSVLRGDRVFVRSSGRKHVGYAHHIDRDRVLLRFSTSFHSSYIQGMKVDVQFSFPRTMLRLQHDGLQHAIRADIQLLFPDHQLQLQPAREVQRKLYNQRLNAEQQIAVQNILEGRSRPAPFIIFGPPGTGKTFTFVEAITCAHKAFGPDFRILACAPSNAAADLLCSRLADYIPKLAMVRLVAYSRNKHEIPGKVRPYCLESDDDDHCVMPSLEQLKTYKIVVATLATASKLSCQLGLEQGHFDMVAIDEAGQAPEPEAVSAVACLLDTSNGGQLVLAGDPMQLGPIIHSVLGKQHGLDKSLLERLSERQLYQRQENGDFDQTLLTKLIKNYRSHPAILELPNRLFYDSELQAHADEMLSHSLAQWEHLPTAGFPIIFHGVAGKDEREGNSPSWFNRHEVEQIKEYVDQLLRERKTPVRPEDIGIIAPYQKQVQKIRMALKVLGMVGNKDATKIVVGSTEQFQGQERRVIILSTVRASQEFVESDARHALGFLSNAKRFNVAITRAQAMLIVVGHPQVLATEPSWRALLKHCQNNGGCIGVPVAPFLAEDGAAAEGVSHANADVELDALSQRLERLEVDSQEPSGMVQQEGVSFQREE